jgi:hypothetical protein
MYMPGRFLTASRPSSTDRWLAVYASAAMAERADLAEVAGSSAVLATVTGDTGGAPSSRKRKRH